MKLLNNLSINSLTFVKIVLSIITLASFQKSYGIETGNSSSGGNNFCQNKPLEFYKDKNPLQNEVYKKYLTPLFRNIEKGGLPKFAKALEKTYSDIHWYYVPCLLNQLANPSTAAPVETAQGMINWIDEVWVQTDKFTDTGNIEIQGRALFHEIIMTLLRKVNPESNSELHVNTRKLGDGIIENQNSREDLEDLISQFNLPHFVTFEINSYVLIQPNEVSSADEKSNSFLIINSGNLFSIKICPNDKLKIISDLQTENSNVDFPGSRKELKKIANSNSCHLFKNSIYTYNHKKIKDFMDKLNLQLKSEEQKVEFSNIGFALSFVGFVPRIITALALESKVNHKTFDKHFQFKNYFWDEIIAVVSGTYYMYHTESLVIEASKNSEFFDSVFNQTFHTNGIVRINFDSESSYDTLIKIFDDLINLGVVTSIPSLN